MQDALRRPPEPKPTVTLPQRFWQEEEDGYQLVEETAKERIIEVVQTSGEGIEQRILESLEAQPFEDDQQTQDLSSDEAGRPAAQEIDRSSQITISTILAPAPAPTSELRLAYILALSSPQQICSALLFFKWQREFGLQSPSLILLYPSLWESQSTNPAYKTALDLMRDAQDTRDVILHPVEISSVWAGITIESQLLGGLQRNWMRWNFDRSIYLRSPGMALDISKLDSALSKSSLKTSWVPLSSAPQDTPSVLLMSAEKNMLMVPRGSMRGLAIDAKTGLHEDHHSKEMEIEARLASKKAGYLVFDEKELEHRRGEKEWYGSVFERFERGQNQVCADTIFVRSESDDRFSVKRGRGM